MLDAFIIEQLKEREREEHNRAERHSRLELPLRYEDPRDENTRPVPQESEFERDRGVVVIDL